MKASGAQLGQLVGRSRELEVVERLLDSSLAGFAALLVEGDAGIGKTSLWQQGIRDASLRGFCVLSARPGSADVRLSFAALGDLVEPVVEETLPALPLPQRRALEGALLLSDEEGPAIDRRAVALAFRGVLRVLSESRPVLVAVDDIQWLDSASGSVLEFVLRRLKTEPIGFLGAFRAIGEGKVPLELDRGLDERLVRLVLGPLSVGALHELVRSRLGLNLPRPTLVRLHQSSGGNPFFALEIGRALRGRELRIDRLLPLPMAMRELWRSRLADLSASAAEALLAVSALSEPRLNQVLASADDRARAVADLDEAVAAGVIEIDGDQVRFTHPLLATACYATSSPVDRRRLHRALAEVAGSSEERARHLALATEEPDAAVAVALDQAAASARARGAPEVAAELTERAVELTPARLVKDHRRRRLAAAALHFEAGDPSRARDALHELLRTAEGVPRAETLLQLGSVSIQTDGIEDAIELYRQALEGAEGNDHLLARVHHAVASGYILAFDLPNAERHASAALALAEQLDDPALLTGCLATAAQTDGLAGRDSAEALSRRALEIDDGTQRAGAAETSPAVVRALCLIWTDRLAEARALLERRRVLALEAQDSSAATYLSYLSLVEGRSGEWARAYALADEAFEVADLTGRESTKPLALHMKAQAAAHLGRTDEARQASERVFALSGRTGQSKRLALVDAGMLGFLELSLGDARAAVQHLEPAAELLHALGVEEPAVFTFVPDAIEALIEIGELERAVILLKRLERQGEQLGRGSALMTAARCRGLLQFALGNASAAEAALHESLERHERLPAARPFELARTLLVLGSVSRRAQQKRAARVALESAAALFERAGTALWTERARSELGRIGGRKSVATELSETERRIADLVAVARSNKQIAQALVISPKTVAWNLTKIYRKLGVASRTELATRVKSPPEATKRS